MDVNCECCVIIKLKRNITLMIHKFKPYNIITNVHHFGQTISTFEILMNN